MGKNRKKLKPQPATHPPTAHAAREVAASPPDVIASGAGFARRIVLQCGVIAGLSAVLGVAFNAANPIGVRFGKAAATLAAATATPTNFNLGLTSSVVVVKPTASPESDPAPPPLPPPVQAAATAPVPTPPTLPPIPRPVLPSPPVTSPHVHAAPAPVPPAVDYASGVALTGGPPVAVNPTPIPWREAKPLVAAGQALLVDVRARPAYDAGHIPGAVSLPESSSPEEFAAFVKQHPTHLTLIVYCSSTSCSQSQRMALRMMKSFGYPSVRFMTGGYLEYQQEELVNRQSAVQQ